MDRDRRDFLTAAAAVATATAAGPLLAEANAAEPGQPAPAQPAAAPPAAAPTAAAGASTEAEYGAPTAIKKITLVNLRELEAAAGQVIPAGGFGYISSAAGDEWTKSENEAAFKRVTISPHYLSGYADAVTTTTLLGAKLSMPIITSVMGAHGLAHASAEPGTAKGTGAAGTLFTAPSQSNAPLEEIAAASPGPKWFQIYIPADRGKARELLQRAKAAGYLAILVTVDAFVSSNRETDVHNNFHSNLPRGNFPGEHGGYGTSPFKRDLGWDDIAFVQKESGLPVLIKGVLTPEFALQAIRHGVAGIQVSNHGGRQLDDVPATLTVLPRIAAAVEGRIPIVMDGGVRRGQDVFKALALGANAVALGRPVLYGLALGGWMGVQTVFEHLNTELVMTMRLAGTRTLGEISKRYLNV